MKTRIIVTVIAYLIGVRDELLAEHYSDNTELLMKLQKDENANKIRHLCIIRNEIMKDYLYFVDNMDNLSYGFGRGLDKIERTKDSAKWLESHGVNVCLFGKKANDHQVHINELIAQNINSIKNYFGQDINFGYIRNLFIIPKYSKIENIKNEARKYCNFSLRNLYPFGLYIHWEPSDNGLILDNDLHFLDVIYRLNNDQYNMPWNYTDADENILECISSFIESAVGKIQMYVDSENVDIYQLVAMLESLNAECISKINKIVVIRDENNHSGWNMINSATGVIVEHHQAVRILDGKSSVDPDLMLDASKDYYTNNISNIIIISSDVDFSSLIRKVDAKYLVFYQKNKISNKTLEFYYENGVHTVALNSFAGHKSESFKKKVFRSEAMKLIKEQFTINGKELVKKIDTLTSMHLSDTELQSYYDRYIKGITIRFDERGDFTIDIPN